MNNNIKILVITPVKHIIGVSEKLEKIGSVTYLDDPSKDEVLEVIEQYDAIYTNPNKSKVFLGEDLIQKAKHLKVICTASTGTNHIDKAYAKIMNIPILALTEEREVINRISSTAEHAFALTLCSLRNIVESESSVQKGEWDYTQFIGRQINCLTVGVIGFGRLGSLYAKYSRAFGAKVIVFDPYKNIENEEYEKAESLDELVSKSDIISLHVHVSEETTNMLDRDLFSKMKSDILLVNTARGDVLNEKDLVDFLSQNPKAKVATDVLCDEIRGRTSSPLLLHSKVSNQILITPHIGGMTREAQEIAFNHAATRLKIFFD